MAIQQFFTNDFVTVHNRTSKPREVRYDGQTGVIPPFPGFAQMSKIAADRALQQNRIPGTEDPYNPREFQSYVGVEAWGWPIDKIDESKAIEALDRSLLPPDRQNPTVVQHGRPRPEKMDISTPEKLIFTGDAEA